MPMIMSSVYEVSKLPKTVVLIKKTLDLIEVKQQIGCGTCVQRSRRSCLLHNHTTRDRQPLAPALHKLCANVPGCYVVTSAVDQSVMRYTDRTAYFDFGIVVAAWLDH